MHPQAEPGGPAGLQHRARLVAVEGVREPGSQNTSTQRACGAQAASIGPVTRPT